MANEGDMEELAQLREQVRSLESRLEASSAVSPAASPPLADPSICKVSLKLPPFTTHKPEIWFAQVEHQFQAARITNDATKYHHVAGLLDPKLACEVEDLILNPPPTGKYEKLKEELTKRLSLSQEQRLRQLLGDVELGAMRPSQFLRHLHSLAGPEMRDKKLLRQLWLRRLPVQAQTVLTALGHLPLAEVAELADKIVEIAQPSTSVHATSTSPATISPTSCSSYASTSTTPLHAPTYGAAPPPISQQLLLDKINELSTQVASLSAKIQHQGGRQQSPERRSNSKNRYRSSNPRTQSSLCWYHQKFGDRARKCTSPCNWTTENASHRQ